MDVRRTMLLSALFLAAGLFLLAGESAASVEPTGARRATQAELSARYREWLDIVLYIIEKDERRVFESLTTDWQRERFIEAFWTRRDPEPVTPENEYRDEYLRRWAYVNDVFGRDTPVPGWRTDRGRVYLVNGPPYQIHPYPNTQQLWPLEIWEYRDNPRPGMPSFYQIIFFKPRVFNEWRLYSPAVDRPEGLVIASPADIGRINLQSLATKFPMVFTAAVQAAPGLGALGSEALIARTMAPPPPPRPLDHAYAALGEAESEFLSLAPLTFHLGATGFVHAEIGGYADIAVELPAETTTFVSVDGQLIANYEVEVEVRTEDAGTWARPAEGLILRVPESDRDVVAGLPIEFRKRIWLLPGRYDLRILVREVATRRIGAAETEVVVPERQSLMAGSPEFFYVTETAGGGDPSPIPWVRRELRRGQPVGSLVRVFDEGGRASSGDLVLEYRVLRGGQVVWSDTWSGDSPLLRIDGEQAVLRNLHFEELPVGHYRLDVAARIGGSAAALTVVRSREFELVDEFLPLARLLPSGDERLDLAAGHHQLGQQRLRRNEFEAARAHFERATRLEPRNPVYKVEAAKTLILSGDLEVAAFLLSEAIGGDPDNQEALATLGLLRLQEGDFEGAVAHYRRALDVAPGTPAIYNGLAEAHLSLGQRAQAIEALDLSLEINSSQDQVRRLLVRLRAGQEDS